MVLNLLFLLTAIPLANDALAWHWFIIRAMLFMGRTKRLSNGSNLLKQLLRFHPGLVILTAVTVFALAKLKLYEIVFRFVLVLSYLAAE